MKLCQGFVFKLKTNSKIEKKFSLYASHNRFVWNKALALIKERLLQREIDKTVAMHLYRFIDLTRFPPYEEMANMLTFWKKSNEYSFLKEAPSQTLQQTLKDLYNAIYASFNPDNGIEFPKFKKKGKSPDSFRYPQGFKIKDNKVFLPKIGWVKFYKSREITGKPKNITVKRYADGWYISIITEQKAEKPKINKTNPIGIDVGVRKTITLSNGYYFSMPNTTKIEKKIIKLERQLNRKQHPRKKGDTTLFSNNYRKHQKKLSKAYLKLSRIRKDFLHKASTAIAKNHDIVMVEDLKIRNMTKSAKGTIDNPGHNVKAKSKLNKKILGQSWGLFFSMLNYKLSRKGGRLIKVNPAQTSQACPVCGQISKLNRKSQAVFKCVACGYENNADLVAAFNILQKGKENPNQTLPQGLREVTPVEYGKVHTLKQEPLSQTERGILFL